MFFFVFFFVRNVFLSLQEVSSEQNNCNFLDAEVSRTKLRLPITASAVSQSSRKTHPVMTSRSAGEREVVEFKAGGRLKVKGGAGRGALLRPGAEPHQYQAEYKVVTHIYFSASTQNHSYFHQILD